MILNHESSTKLEQPVRVTIAAAPPSPTLFRELLEKNFAPVHVYGLTETYGPVMKYDSAPCDDVRISGILTEQGLPTSEMANEG